MTARASRPSAVRDFDAIDSWSRDYPAPIDTRILPAPATPGTRFYPSSGGRYAFTRTGADVVVFRDSVVFCRLSRDGWRWAGWAVEGTARWDGARLVDCGDLREDVTDAVADAIAETGEVAL